jgi:DNA-binding response OmpR family regulator
MGESSLVPGTPLVLVINDEEWTTRSIESILKPHGYAVLMAYTGRQGLELASKIRPDILLVDLRLPDVTGIDLCARLRELPTVRPSTPMLLFTSGSIDRAERLAAFRSGAWGVLQPPFNPEELLAQLAPFAAAKQDADTAFDTSHLDPLTGFYNMRGLLRRVVEITADTARSRRPLACVALGPLKRESGVSGDAGLDFSRSLGNILLVRDPAVGCRGPDGRGRLRDRGSGNGPGRGGPAGGAHRPCGPERCRGELGASKPGTEDGVLRHRRRGFG